VLAKPKSKVENVNGFLLIMIKLIFISDLTLSTKHPRLTHAFNPLKTQTTALLELFLFTPSVAYQKRIKTYSVFVARL
jgi:hypothetical protein